MNVLLSCTAKRGFAMVQSGTDMAENPITAGRASIDAREDTDLLRAYAEFKAIHEELDRLLEGGPEPSETELYRLNKRWTDICLRAVSLPAATPAGRHAKAQMLLAVMHVVAGLKEERYDLHERLAVSLACDC